MRFLYFSISLVALGLLAKIAMHILFAWLAGPGNRLLKADGLVRAIHCNRFVSEWPYWAWLMAGPILVPIMLGLFAMIGVVSVKWKLHDGRAGNQEDR